MAQTQPPSAEVTEQDEKIHRLAEAVREAIAAIPGVSETEIVGHFAPGPDSEGTDQVFYGFDYAGLPISLSWNVTP